LYHCGEQGVAITLVGGSVTGTTLTFTSASPFGPSLTDIVVGGDFPALISGSSLTWQLADTSANGLTITQIHSGGQQAACPLATSSQSVAFVTDGNLATITASASYVNGNAAIGLGHALVSGTVSIHDNFVDPTGLLLSPFISTGGATCATPATFSNNLDLVTNSTTEAGMIGWDGHTGTGC
jgi:hypothetical protein